MDHEKGYKTMKNRVIACLLMLSLLLGGACPVALAADISVSFESAKLTYESGESSELVLVATSAPEKDLTVTVKDNKKNTYEVVIPAGQTRAALPVSSERTASGSKVTFTIQKSEDYLRKTPYESVVTARAATMYTFANGVYQTYAGRDLAIKVRVANPDRLDKGTVVTLRDEDGNVLETISHNPSRTAYNFTYKTDDSWRPGKTLSVWVEGRDKADAQTLAAVGISGVKSIYGVNRDDKKISFTMDCGSGSSNLPTILDILDEFGVKITFFVTGKFAQANPEMVTEMAARGHEIGNHSWSHPSFYELSGEQMLKQLYDTNDLIYELTGKTPDLFRPPFGDCNSKVRAIVNAAGFDVIRWTHESYDARKEASEANSLKYSTKDMEGGCIVLTHIEADCTTAVLRDIMQWYKDNGFEVVPVSELLLEGNTSVDENGRQYVITE